MSQHDIYFNDRNHFNAFQREQDLGIDAETFEPETTQVLRGAEYIFHNSIDVSLNLQGIKSAASILHNKMNEVNYSTKNWSLHQLHPKAKDESTLNFIFTMDLLNFSFWSEKNSEERFSIEYKQKKWTGYWSLVAALQRALEENIAITSPSFWVNSNECTNEVLRYIFRSATQEEIPLFQDRVEILREAGKVLFENFNGSFLDCIEASKNSAVRLVNLLATSFSCFNDVVDFEGEKNIRFLKRAQICVADIWAAFDGESYGEFHDIDQITSFADYRIPQILNILGCLSYSPPLENTIFSKEIIPPGHIWEIQIRGCSIWCVELIRREILRRHPESKVTSILLDFFLFETIKTWEADGKEFNLPHHRTRSIWY